MSNNTIKVGDKVWHPLTGDVVIIPNNRAIGEVVRVIEQYQSPDSPGLAQVKLTPPMQWPAPIPVSERLPEVGEMVLWFSQGSWECGTLEEFTLDGKRWYKPDYHWDIAPVDDATHWVPLPPKPE